MIIWVWLLDAASSRMKVRSVGRRSGAYSSPVLSDSGRSVIRRGMSVIGCPDSCTYLVIVAIIFSLMLLTHCLSTSSLALDVNRSSMSGKLWEYRLFSLTCAFRYTLLLCCLNFTWMCLMDLYPGSSGLLSFVMVVVVVEVNDKVRYTP